MDKNAINGESPAGLADALNPCVGSHGEWLAECIYLKIPQNKSLPIKIVHARPLRLP